MRMYQLGPTSAQFKGLRMEKTDEASGFLLTKAVAHYQNVVRPSRNILARTTAAMKEPSQQMLNKMWRGFGKFKMFGRTQTAFTPGMVGVALGGLALGGQIVKSLWSRSQRGSVLSSRQGAGAGPGYISWSKKTGMPANHLGTRGLTNALHRNRHNSII